MSAAEIGLRPDLPGCNGHWSSCARDLFIFPPRTRPTCSQVSIFEPGLDPALALITAPSRGCLTCRVSPSCLTDTLVKSDSLEFYASSYNLILIGRVFCRRYSREEYFDVLKIPDYKQFESLIGKSRQSRHTNTSYYHAHDWFWDLSFLKWTRESYSSLMLLRLKSTEEEMRL